MTGHHHGFARDGDWRIGRVEKISRFEKVGQSDGKDSSFSVGMSEETNESVCADLENPEHLPG
ncbi:MAG: hypothetical protein D6741_21000 [Planctomycetota bacterium]|nr:MAG: hypothetical protein D6741_21000 [Planctomycetota bacterium]